MTFKEQVQAVIDGILAGKILETFEEWYADDIIMSENSIDDRIGKEANRAYEEAFVANVDFHGAQVGRVIIDEEGQQAAVEWTFDMTPKGGERVVYTQVAVQSWRDGKVYREIFYYKG